MTVVPAAEPTSESDLPQPNPTLQDDTEHAPTDIIEKKEKTKPTKPKKAEAKKGEAVLTPNKVLRITAMLKKIITDLLPESLEMHTRQELAETYAKSRKLVAKCLSPDLRKELNLLVPKIKVGKHTATPSEAELRLAYAQLVGWLEGLFGGIQTLLAVQQGNQSAQTTGIKASIVPGTTLTTSKAITDSASLEAGLRPGQYL